MIDQPLVSVLMPVYNGAKYLAEAIESILQQTYTHFELVIVNDGSTDTSEQIILAYEDPRIRYVKNEENLGIVRTRNKLFTLAKGEYLAIMDCDDVAYPQKLALQVSFLEQHPSYGLCGTWAKMIDEEQHIKGYIQPPSENNMIRINLLFQSSFVQSTVVIRRQALGILQYDEDFPVAEDFDLWERLSRQTQMHNIPQFLLQYRSYSANISHSKELLLSNKRNVIIQRQLAQWGKVDAQLLQTVILVGNLLKLDQAFPFSRIQHDLQYFIHQNKTREIYPSSDFEAFVWYRYIFYCAAMKRWSHALGGLIHCYNPVVFGKLIRLLYSKIRKK